MPIPIKVNPRCNVNPKNPRQVPLWHCVDRAARELGLSHGTVALAMTYWLEELAAQLTKGRTVRINGFGNFYPTWDKRSDYVRPKFSHSRGFAMQMRWGCSTSFDQSKSLHIHQDKRCANARKSNMRVFTGMEQMRSEIRKQTGATESE